VHGVNANLVLRIQQRVRLGLVEGVAKQAAEGVEAFRRQVAALHPLGHIGEPNDIAYGILYLASDESKFVTASELVIDGGYTAQ
jgi:NAD(P)-dependent dehydrogenase (short-subunit alcohol dehydrogenase family)